jgi:hypothetical protein
VIAVLDRANSNTSCVLLQLLLAVRQSGTGRFGQLSLEGFRAVHGWVLLLVFCEAHSIAFGWLCWSQGFDGKAILRVDEGEQANARYFLG